MGLRPVLQALASRPKFTKLEQRSCPLHRDEARLLQMASCNIRNLLTFDLRYGNLGRSTLGLPGKKREMTSSIECLLLDWAATQHYQRSNSITSTGVGLLLETIEQCSHHISDIDLRHNSFGIEGANLIAS